MLRPISNAEYFEVLKNFGKNSQSFLGIYQPYTHISFDQGAVIAYRKQGKTLFAVGAPIGTPESQAQALEDLKSHAETVALVACYEEEAAAAEAHGYRKLFLGLDPVFELSHWLCEYAGYPAAKKLLADGAKVECLDPDHMTSNDRREFNQMSEEWLQTRKIPPLGFLNEVRLWDGEEHKKYFRLKFRGRTIAVLVAVPTPATGNWYLIDLLRGRRAENGASELLFFEAMRYLQNQGAKRVNLGMAPMAGVEWTEKYFSYFYNFKSLYDFKSKLNPTRWEKVYLCYSPAFTLRNWFDFIKLVQPAGFLKITLSWLTRSIRQFPLSRTLQTHVRDGFIVDDFPEVLGDLLPRARLTTRIAIVLVLLHWLINSLEQWSQKHAVQLCMAYEYKVPMKGPCFPIFSSMFFHWNWSHLFLNLALLFPFGSLAETIFGWRRMLGVFLVSAVGGQLCTTAFLSFFPNENPMDLGASLGIFGVAGMVAWALKPGAWLVFLLSLSALVGAFLLHDLSQMNHIFSLFIGYLLCHLMFYPRKRYA